MRQVRKGRKYSARSFRGDKTRENKWGVKAPVKINKTTNGKKKVDVSGIEIQTRYSQSNAMPVSISVVGGIVYLCLDNGSVRVKGDRRNGQIVVGRVDKSRQCRWTMTVSPEKLATLATLVYINHSPKQACKALAALITKTVGGTL